MSILADVLSAANKMDVEAIRKDIPVICKKISHFKAELDDFIECEYVTFLRQHGANRDLIQKSTKLNTEVDYLQTKVDVIKKTEIAGIYHQIESLVSELEEANFELKFVTQLVHIHETLQKARNFRGKNLFTEAVMEMNHIEDFIDKLPAIKVSMKYW